MPTSIKLDQHIVLTDTQIPLRVDSGIKDYENLNLFVDHVLAMIKSNQSVVDDDEEGAATSENVLSERNFS